MAGVRLAGAAGGKLDFALDLDGDAEGQPELLAKAASNYVCNRASCRASAHLRALRTEEGGCEKSAHYSSGDW